LHVEDLLERAERRPPVRPVDRGRQAQLARDVIGGGPHEDADDAQRGQRSDVGVFRVRPEVDLRRPEQALPDEADADGRSYIQP
jgi:hypothetical protein